MARRYKPIADKLEAYIKQKREWEIKNPPITRISVKEANSNRVFTNVGDNAVECNLPCNGSYIPKKYSLTGDLVDATKMGVEVEGWDSYIALTCRQAEGKICVTKDERLRRAIER